MTVSAKLTPAVPLPPPEGTVTLTMSETDALQLLAITGKIGGNPVRTGRGTFDQIGEQLRTALGFRGHEIIDGVSGMLDFHRVVQREEFVHDSFY